jgi:nucleotide-binding universal stress UspA family protein
VREVLQGGHDTVVHVARGRRRLFRATTMVQLARLCPCPLWVIRPPGRPGREHLLAAVSLNPLDGALDREILDTALAVARLLDRTLHVVHAWDAPGIHLFAFRTSAADLAWYRRAVMRQHREQLDELMGHYRLAIPRERVHLRHGLPVEVIPRVAAELAADPIVMGTAARRGIAGFLAGNTAERVVHRSERSVLIVKAPGFVSPAAPRPARARALTPAQVSVLA